MAIPVLVYRDAVERSVECKPSDPRVYVGLLNGLLLSVAIWGVIVSVIYWIW